ncbi:Acetyl esterase/lipase [Alkalibacterium subtropicum]|uniref:Acetyl esterase/lipase n=1 Tax=Alkalibacterium subtropicum TaxID=753702 RepID=A0A1I1JMG8_9LACT|nr:alpha/beta hydrolase [Alkalibacterium subtropicum]SFC49809.1 Acetyl esterase/lipase [Alkalibacterium subtropicum]
MNPVFKFLLRLASSPRIDMQEDYRWVRKVQKFFSSAPTARFRTLDEKIYSVDNNHEIPVRIFYPKKKRHPEPILYIHGGGWVIGDIDYYTRACVNIADQLGRVVYSVDYRLAPENPFPAGLNDVYRVAEVLLTPLEDEEDEDWIIMGDSAGGNLAAVVSMLLRDREKRMPQKQVLIYPLTYWDHTEKSPFESVRTNGYDYGMTIKKIQGFMELYGPDMAERKSPMISPLMAEDLNGLPDTLIITAEFDPLRDEGEAYGKALRKAGNRVRIHRVLNSVHGFINYPAFTEPMEETLKEMETFLND